VLCACTYRKAKNCLEIVPLYKKIKKRKLFYIGTFVTVLIWAKILSDWFLLPLQQALTKDKSTDDLFQFGCSRQQKRHAAAPPPARVWRRMERNRQKLVGRHKGSLTEQQTKGTGTTTIQMRRIHKTNQQNRARRTEPLSWTEPPLCSPKPRVNSLRPASPHRNPA